ncbi:MAG: Gfo/Idh/MocA family oxidoreductase [Spirochaetales bacterium]|nr:Gfo/Idh/MocA family oxidoreductase [Spirochaetales bacterium]
MKPLGLGVLGVSRHYGLRLRLPLLKSESIRLVALGSRSAERAASTAATWGFEKGYGSYEAVLDDPEVEAVYIPLPNDSHGEWTKKCADAGKAVICEKPFAMNRHEALDVAQYVAQKGVVGMEAFMYRFHPQWQRAKELMEIGEIGQVLSIQTVFSYKNADPQNIRNQLVTGGGGLYDIGCYAISSARFLLGGEPQRVVSLLQRDDVDGTDVLTSALMDFGQAHMSFTVGTRMAPRQKVTVYGSGGSLELLLPFNAYPDVPLTLRVDNGLGYREIACGPADQYQQMFEAFASAVRQGGPAPTPLEDAVANMAAIDAVFRSEKSGSWEIVH